MATTQITDAAFELACAECADAINSGSWATARTKYAVAEAINAGMGLSRLTTGSTDKTRRDSLAGLRNAITYAETASKSETDNRRMIKTRMKF